MHANPNRCTLLDEPAETAHSRAVPCRCRCVQGHAFPARSCGIPGMREMGAQREPDCAAKLSQAAPRRKKTFLSPSSGRYAKCGMTCHSIHPTGDCRREQQ